MKTHKARMFLRPVVVLAVALTGASLAQAQSCTVSWTNKTGDGLWSTAGNWSTNHVPGATDDICILSTAGAGSCGGGCVDATGVPSISINSLLVDQGASVDFGSGTVSIATSLAVQGLNGNPGGGKSVVLLSGTNLNCPSIQVGDSSHVGLLEGSGTVEGSITNNGGFFPFGLTVTGNYTQTSGGGMDVDWGGPTALKVNGNATLSGDLGVITDAPKNPPKSGSTYTFMTFGSLSGEFTSISTSGISVKYNTNSAVAKYH